MISGNNHILAKSLVVFTLMSTQALAQRQADPSDMVRERAAVARDILDPYWNGFIAKARGNCELAIQELTTIAAQGRGFEDAQTALGLCEMMQTGYRPEAKEQEQPDALARNAGFLRGRNLIIRAADAGFHGAQAEMARLYMFKLGPDADPAEGAKWAQLYVTNPVRLSIGLENNITDVVRNLEDSLSSQAWLEGKERARYWYPVFDFMEPPAGSERADHRQSAKKKE